MFDRVLNTPLNLPANARNLVILKYLSRKIRQRPELSNVITQHTGIYNIANMFQVNNKDQRLSLFTLLSL